MIKFSDDDSMSNPSTACISKKLKEKVDDKENQKGKKIGKTDEITKVADGQDFLGASHMAVAVVLEPSSRENSHKAGLMSKPSEKSYTKSTDAVLSTTVKDVSSQLQPVEEFTGIPETRGTSRQGKRITQNKEFSEQGSVECSNVILSAIDEIRQVSDRPVELHQSNTTSNTTQEDLNKKEDNKKIIEEKEDDEEVPQLQQEPHRISVEVHEPGLPEAKKRITQSREVQREAKIKIPRTDEQGNAEQVFDFSAKDLLSFAWQIAQGMVSAEINCFHNKKGGSNSPRCMVKEALRNNHYKTM